MWEKVVFDKLEETNIIVISHNIVNPQLFLIFNIKLFRNKRLHALTSVEKSSKFNLSTYRIISCSILVYPRAMIEGFSN